MNAVARKFDLPVSPILSDRDHWLFDGPGVDPYVASTAVEAEAHAIELNSDKQRYAVVRFNAVDGLCRDVTEDFWRAPETDREDDEATVAQHRAWLNQGIYR